MTVFSRRRHSKLVLRDGGIWADRRQYARMQGFRWAPKLNSSIRNSPMIIER
jgi:hypothetical protein